MIIRLILIKLEKILNYVIGKYGNNKTILYTLIPNFTKYSKAKADSWANQNGFTIVYEEVELKDQKQYLLNAVANLH